MDCTNNEMLKIIYGDATLGIGGRKEGKEFHYIFSYAAGGMESLYAEGKEWLYSVPKPTFWRAATDNDRGNQFCQKSGVWIAADLFIKCIDILVKVDGKEIPLPVMGENNQYSEEERAEEVELVYTYETVTNPPARVQVSYQVKTGGRIFVSVHYKGTEGLPQLPVFGMRFIMPTCADKFIYEGLSGETYPDRKAGGIKGIYEVEGLLVTPYLRPQDCGMHMDTKWVEIYRSRQLSNCQKEEKQTCIRFEMEKLGFSCLPYTACELENADHQEELPPKRRTVVCIYGAVRGVGGIDSWGADVEPAYHVDAEKDIDFSFCIVPFAKA